MRDEVPVQEFLISDVLWELIEPLLPIREKPFHPLGCHRPRVSDRKVLNSIFYLLRTGGQWQSLDSLDPIHYAKRSTSHTRFQEWLEMATLRACGKRVCWTMTKCKDSTLRGWPWMVR
jgi:transposase